MAVIIPQVVTEDRASGAQVVDGSLRFDNDKSQYLTRTPGSAGNRNVWTWSAWVKKTNATEQFAMFSAYGSGSNAGYGMLWFQNNGVLYFHNWDGQGYSAQTDATFRDTGWYHVVAQHDESASSKMKFYVNGTEQSLAYNLTGSTAINDTIEHRIGMEVYNSRKPYDGHMSQVYFIDGQALGPEEFGFTDPLTNTWRPKKYEGTFGTNGFWLPMDGNSPIGEDKSGNGNNWTPVNFGGSAGLDKATGAKPILNTGNGGTAGRPGVFGSEVSKYYTILGTSGGGNPYVFEDLGNRPQLSFIRGATYTFDWSAASSHPLRFATAADAAGSTEYTDGTDVTGNVTTITVPHDAPDTLYYYCNVHGGMGNSISVTTDETKADPYAWKCVFAAPFTSNSKDVSDQINCNSAQKSNSSSDVGVTYNTTITSTNFYNSYGVYAPGGGTSQKVVYSDSEDFNLDGPFTIEFFIKMNSDTDCTIICDDGVNGDPQVKYTTTYDRIQLQSSNVNIEIDENANTALLLSDGNWHHVAFTRSAVNDTNAIYLFIDGVAQTLRARQNSAGSSVNFNQMALFTGAVGRFPGYMQDLRIYKGIAKYTSDFIPASTNPNILPDTPSGVAFKSQLTKITDGAVSFDGISGTDGDYLSTPVSSSDFTFGTGDFTIEMFLYNRETGGEGFIQFSDTAGGLKATSTGVITIHKGSGENGIFRAYIKNGSTGFSTPVPYKRWCHVALVRESGTIKLFVDGKQDATTVTNDTTDYATTYVAIGGYYDTDYLSDCTISNVRVNKGTALYTSDFTPPTEPLTAVTNTKLLCCQSNTEPGRAAASPSISGINDGINWSHYVTGDIDSAFPAWRAFRNDTTSVGCRTQTANGATIVWQPPSPIAFSSSFKIWAARDGASGGTFTVTHAGGVTDFTSSVVTSTTQTAVDLAQIGGVTSPITKITIVSGGPNPRFSGIEVDSVMLLDPISPRGHASASTFNPFTTDINAVRGQEGVYATLNPLISTVSLSDGNLKQAQTSGTWNVAVSSIPMSTGKWYCEVTLLDGNTFQMGIIKLDDGPSWVANFPLVDFPYGWGMIVDGSTAKLRSDYITQLNGRTDATYNSTAPVTGDTVGMAYDADTQALTFYVNGVNYGDTTSYWEYPPTPGEYVFGNSVVSNTDALWNFGQKPFKFSPPDGFQPLTSSTARPDTVIPNSSQYFGVMTYTGTSDSTATVTSENINFTPDFVWCKSRGNTEGHAVYDSVRGGEKLIRSNTTEVETSGSANLQTFIPGGFTTGNNGHVYYNGYTYVAWMWKAGGNKGVFNVDDLGYASASDVNMSVGSLNSAAYNQSQVWTNYSGDQTTKAPSNVFDGNSSTNFGFPTSAGNGNSGTFLFSITGASSIRIRAYTGYVTNANGSFSVNGSNIQSRLTTSPQWITIPGSSLSSITMGKGNAGSGNFDPVLEAVEVDGKILVDSTSTPTNVPSIAATGSSVGTKQGFSIVKYAGSSTNGSTLAHGLGQIPDFVICKNLGTTYNWFIWHNEFGNGTNAGIYFTDAAKTTGYGTQPFVSLTEHAITLNNNDGVNGNYNYIMYAWHNVPGLQKFGRYESNSNGVFVELGFRPALLVIKNVDATLTNSQWNVVDTQRDTYNSSLNNLAWNRNNSEPAVSASTYGIDILSNGFAIPSGNTGEAINDVNANPQPATYIYAAWAEAPAFNLYGAQSNAR